MQGFFKNGKLFNNYKKLNEMKINLNKEADFDTSNLDNVSNQSYPQWELGVEIDGKQYTINADIDIEYSVYSEEDECGNLFYIASNINGVYVLFNEAWDEDGSTHIFNHEEIAEIEQSIKLEIAI